MKFRIWPKALWMRVLVVGLLVVLLPYLFSRLASASRRVSLHQLKIDQVFAGREAIQNTDLAQSFRIACYNIAHGRGLADSNSAGGDRQERLERLDSIAELLREVDADIVVLKPIQVLAVHLEHRSEEARVAAVKRMLDQLQKGSWNQGSWNQMSCPTLLVGDLNSAPTGFPESATDAAGENAIDILDDSNLFRRKPELWPSDSDESEFTFRSDKPDRVIDWIMIPRHWQFRKYSVHPSQLSDHRLIFAEVER